MRDIGGSPIGKGELWDGMGGEGCALGGSMAEAQPQDPSFSDGRTSGGLASSFSFLLIPSQPSRT